MGRSHAFCFSWWLRHVGTLPGKCRTGPAPHPKLTSANVPVPYATLLQEPPTALARRGVHRVVGAHRVSHLCSEMPCAGGHEGGLGLANGGRVRHHN